MSYVPIMGCVSNNINEYVFLFASGHCCIYSNETQGVKLGSERNIPGILGTEQGASKIAGCIEFGTSIFIFTRDGKLYSSNIGGFGNNNLREGNIRNSFPKIAPYARKIIAILPKPPTPSGFGGIMMGSTNWDIFLDNNTVFEYSVSRQDIVQAPRTISDVYPGLRHTSQIRAAVRSIENINRVYFFLNDGSYIGYENGRMDGPNLTSVSWQGIYYRPDISIFSILEIYKLTCEQSSELGKDEMSLEYIKDGRHIDTDGPRDMNELNNSRDRENSHKLWLSRWELNKRFYFQNQMKVKVIERDRIGKDDFIGELKAGNDKIEKGTKSFSDSGSYKLSYKVIGKESDNYDIPLLIVSFRYYHDVFARAVNATGLIDGKDPLEVVISSLEDEFRRAAEAARADTVRYNRAVDDEFNDYLLRHGREAAMSIAGSAFVASVGAYSVATIVGVQATAAGAAAGAVGAAAGIAALQAAAITGGIGVAVVAAVVAIALPVYFSQMRFSVFILIANNLDLDLEVDWIWVDKGYQESGTFEDDIILRKNPQNISLATFVFKDFGNEFGGMNGEIHLKPKFREGDRRIMEKGVIIKFQVPLHGNNTASIVYRGGTVNALRNWSKIRIDAKGDTPNLLVNLSET